jgi:hypothetical protein
MSPLKFRNENLIRKGNDKRSKRQENGSRWADSSLRLFSFFLFGEDRHSSALTQAFTAHFSRIGVRQILLSWNLDVAEVS